MPLDLTANEQILLDRTRTGQSRRPCPWCSGSRKNKTETCLSVNRDDERIVYSCHHCGIDGIIVMRETHRSHEKLKPREEKKIERRKREEFDNIDDRHLDWLTGRGISASTAQKYDLIGEDIGGVPVISFPYYDKDGNVVAAKKRFTNEKKFLCWQTPDSFFGIKQLKKGDNLYIVEGEMDVLALAEIGIRAVSVPNGAPMKVTEGKIDPSEDGKFKFLWDAKEYIDAAERIFIATDQDGPGEALAEEIARRVGKGKSWRIKFPEGIKDSNDCLVKCGTAALKRAAEAAQPWPVQGLYDAEHFRDLVWELYEKGAGKGESTGYHAVDELYTVVPGQITIVTGIPSSGKSEFVDQLMINLASEKGWRLGICSFENEPRLHIAKLMAKRAKMHFFEGPTRRMSNEECKAAFDWVQEHFAFVWQDDGSLADLDSILDRLRVAILRYGIRGAVIDPYNFISRDNRDKSETEWISDMLTKVKAFAMGHGVHIWFVAHPTKLQRGTDGKVPVPGGYDISGSAAWFAKADCGVTVHREKDDPLTAQIHVWKCRFSWVGKQGSTNLLYNTATTCYVEPVGTEEGGFEL